MNPISDLIPDDTYDLLNSFKLFNENAIRNRMMKRKFDECRAAKMTQAQAVEAVRESYPHLSFESVRKICNTAQIQNKKV